MAWYDYVTPGNDKFLGGVLPTSDKFDRGQNEFRGVDPTGKLNAIGNRSGRFGDLGVQGYQDRTAQLGGVTDKLGRLMSGEDSLAAEQLRQGLQQNIAGQQAMAAGARGGNQAMAARNAMMNAGRMGAGMSGQAALAGIQERNAAAGQLGQLLGQMRGQDIQAGLGGYGQQLGAQMGIENQRGARFGALTQQPTSAERGIKTISDMFSMVGGLGG